ncbi:MAG: DNA mismatch repair protein [Deltaproteobacteria bacterium]|nr:DNA mismatch repair protein [Deltaproteobacteria bacterium]
MEFAFASGVSGGLFAEALQKSIPANSRWEPEAFANDLFLEDFVSRCYLVRIGGRTLQAQVPHLIRLLATPPSTRAGVDHRRAIAEELASSPALRSEFEQLYVLLCRFRTGIEGATLNKRFDQNRRQLDLLTLAKQIFDRMASGFATATSGLARLSTFGSQVQATEPYQSMAQLLHYDDNLATLDLRVRVGSDGYIRGFQISSLKENEKNIFFASPWRRWLSKLELVFRGFQFGDGEVMARLIDAVFDGIVRYLVHFVQLLGDMEFYLGALGFRDLSRAAGLEVCLPTLVSADSPRVLTGLFNPLLVAHGTRAVPCNLRTDRHSATVLITGPNSGGKTRLLQSIGIAQLLAQAGVFIPATQARMALCPALVVSLIQETRADQAEGRLGMEMIRIRALFEKLPPGAMVILDELCSGTNPSEGEQIFELVLGVLTRLRPQAFITTHFLTFAARLEREMRIADLRFFQVELDQHQQPTYQFLDGVATTSLAQRAAERLGVTGDQLLSLVERNVALAEKAGR